MNTYRWIIRYAATYWPSFLIAIIAMVVDAASAAAFANLVKPMIDETFSLEPSFPAWQVASMIAGLLAVRSLAGYVGDTRMSYVGRMTVRDVRDDVFEAQLDSVEIVGRSESVGDRVANISYAVEQVAFSVTDAAKIIVLDGCTATFCVAIMIYLSPPMAATMAVVIPFMAIIAVYSGASVRRLSAVYQGHVSEANTVIVESWSNSRYIKIFRAFESVRAKFIVCSARIAEIGMTLSRVSSAASAATQLSGGVSLALVVLVASGTIFPMQNPVSAGAFFAVITAMGMAVPSLRRLSGVYAGIQRGLVAADLLRNALSERPVDGMARANCGAHAPDIEFVDVALTYGDGQHALVDVSVRFHAGQLTLIVGESGSGKSSLLGLLPRFRSPSRGFITIDGVTLNSYSHDSVYAAITWVGSSACVMTGTVRENIAFGELHATNADDIIRAARYAHAWDFIEKLPNGLDTRIGVGGIDLSEGQRQRLLIARAMLKKAPIVLLDEATSALDRATERIVGDGIVEAFRGSTVLMATHRLDLAAHADQIVVMDQGRIVEIGTHDELMGRRSAYWRLISRATARPQAA